MNEVRLDSLGRAIHPNRWKGLVKFQSSPAKAEIRVVLSRTV